MNRMGWHLPGMNPLNLRNRMHPSRRRQLLDSGAQGAAAPRQALYIGKAIQKASLAQGGKQQAGSEHGKVRRGHEAHPDV